MGHMIEHFSYKESINKKSILNELDDYMRKATWQSGGDSLNMIRWYDNTICPDYDSAIQFLEENDRGWYDNLAVKYKKLDNSKSSKKLDDLNLKYKEAYKKYHDLTTKVVFKEFKSQYIGCKNCGSKLNKDYLNTNFCPLCKHDMRSDTTLNQISSLEKKVKDIELQLKEEKRKLAEKHGKVYWLVKIEYHI